MGSAGRAVERAVRRTIRGVGEVAGGVVDGILGTNITGNQTLPTMNVDVEESDPSLSTPTTPENSPTQIGTGDTTDTGFGDITSIFSVLTKQEDEWDQFLGRYSKK